MKIKFIPSKIGGGIICDEDDYKEYVKKHPKLTMDQFVKIVEALGNIKDD